MARTKSQILPQTKRLVRFHQRYCKSSSFSAPAFYSIFMQTTSLGRRGHFGATARHDVLPLNKSERYIYLFVVGSLVKVLKVGFAQIV